MSFQIIDQNKYPKTRVLFSPIGPGIVTGTTSVGYLKVNDIAVTWMILYHLEEKRYYFTDDCFHLREGKIKIFYKKGYDPLKDIPINVGSIIVGSQEQFLQMQKEIGFFGNNIEVILEN